MTAECWINLTTILFKKSGPEKPRSGEIKGDRLTHWTFVRNPSSVKLFSQNFVKPLLPYNLSHPVHQITTTIYYAQSPS